MKNICKIIFPLFAILLFNGCGCDHPSKKGNVVEITTRGEFDEAIKCPKPVVAKLSAPWCGACKVMDPIFKDASDKYDDVKFIHINVDNVGGVVEEFEVKGIPAFIYFKNGEQVKKIEGSMEQVDFEKTIDSLK